MLKINYLQIFGKYFYRGMFTERKCVYLCFIKIKEKMNNTKFHKTFGQVEVLSETSSILEIKIVSTGEIKKLASKFLVGLLSDVPFVKEAAKKSVSAKSIVLTEEEKNHMSSIQGKLRWMDKKLEENRKAGKYGASKFM